jgi:transposase
MLSPGNDHDAPRGRELLKNSDLPRGIPLLADRAYEDNQTRELAVQLGLTPVIPPRSTRKEPWKYDKELYKKRNEIERLFRRLKRFRRIFTRYEKLDVMYLGFLYLAFIYDALICVNTT